MQRHCIDVHATLFGRRFARWMESMLCELKVSIEGVVFQYIYAIFNANNSAVWINTILIKTSLLHLLLIFGT